MARLNTGIIQLDLPWDPSEDTQFYGLFPRPAAGVTELLADFDDKKQRSSATPSGSS